MEAAWLARSKWKNIGLELQIDVGTLDAIERSNQGIVEDCFRDMLKTWLRMAWPKPTIEALAKALRSPTVGFVQLAEEILSLK